MSNEQDPPSVRGASASLVLSVEAELKGLRKERQRLQEQEEARQQEEALRHALNQQEEIVALRTQIAELTRRGRDVIVAPSVPVTPMELTLSFLTNDLGPADSASQMGTRLAPVTGTKRRRFRDPEVFKGKTLKEAIMFLLSLRVIFSIDPVTYETDLEKILFASTWLAYEPRALWSYAHPDGLLLEYTFKDFKDFVFDCVADPVNRSLNVG